MPSSSFPLSTEQRNIIRQLQRLHARRFPLNISAVKRSHPKLIGKVYQVRPFWGWKRALEDAGLSYSKINIELRDYVDCEICGRDFGALVSHLISEHEMTPEDYRLVYPEAELTCETVRASLSVPRTNKRTTLPRWEPIWTPEYVLDRMAELRRLKFPLNPGWAGQHEKALNAMAVKYFGSWQEALRRIGLDPRTAPEVQPAWEYRSPWWRADKAAIIAELRRRKETGQRVSGTRIVREKHGPAFLERARKLFGSWNRALVAADLEPLGGIESLWHRASKSALLTEIRRRVGAGESLLTQKVGREKWGKPFLRRVTKLFGSWSVALLMAGVEPKSAKSAWPIANRADVLDEIRWRHQASKSLRTTDIEHEPWGHALLRRGRALFGSWGNALRAAGVDLPSNMMSPWPKANKDEVLSEIRRRSQAGKSLRYKDIERGRNWGVALLRRATVLFGSWNDALLTAGVEPPEKLTSPWLMADKAAIRAEIRRRHRAGTLDYMRVRSEKWGTALQDRIRKLFGSWSAALCAAGIKPKIERSPWPKADEAAVLAEVRRRKRTGKPLAPTRVRKEKWGTALVLRSRDLFGSWSAALVEAGIVIPDRPS